jgi:hypothetical protein
MKLVPIDIIYKELDKFNKRWAGLYHAKSRLNIYTSEVIIDIGTYYFDHPLGISRAYPTDQNIPVKRRDFRKFLEAARKDIVADSKPKVTEPVEKTLTVDIRIPPSDSLFGIPSIIVHERGEFGIGKCVDRIHGDRALELYEKLGGRLR